MKTLNSKELKLKGMQRKLMNYDRRMIVFMKKATVEEVSMELGSPGEAIHLRQQMYRCRKLMRDMDHPESPMVEGMQLKVMDRILIGVPISQKFDDAFKNAGIEDDFGGADDDLSHLVEQPQRGTQPLLDQTLSSLDQMPEHMKGKADLVGKTGEPDFSDAAGPYGED